MQRLEHQRSKRRVKQYTWMEDYMTSRDNDDDSLIQYALFSQDDPVEFEEDNHDEEVAKCDAG